MGLGMGIWMPGGLDRKVGWEENEGNRLLILGFDIIFDYLFCWFNSWLGCRFDVWLGWTFFWLNRWFDAYCFFCYWPSCWFNKIGCGFNTVWLGCLSYVWLLTNGVVLEDAAFPKDMGLFYYCFF